MKKILIATMVFTMLTVGLLPVATAAAESAAVEKAAAVPSYCDIGTQVTKTLRRPDGSKAPAKATLAKYRTKSGVLRARLCVRSTDGQTKIWTVKIITYGLFTGDVVKTQTPVNRDSYKSFAVRWTPPHCAYADRVVVRTGNAKAVFPRVDDWRNCG